MTEHTISSPRTPAEWEDYYDLRWRVLRAPSLGADADFYPLPGKCLGPPLDLSMFHDESLYSRSDLGITVSVLRPPECNVIDKRPCAMRYVLPQNLRNDALIASYRIRPPLW
jgi:hypothetical protein